MRFDVITIFPEAFDSPLQVGLLGKAIASGIIDVKVHDMRRWGMGPHKKVDDMPFGGGAGMVMAPGPVVEAVEAVSEPEARILLMSAAGKPLTQEIVAKLTAIRQVVLVCGRYEGMDDRIRQALGAEEVSIGQFVLSGGELPALCVIEAVSRLVPAVLGNRRSLDEESFGAGLLEYPQYTRPAEFRGLKVPDILLSGDHAKIASWRRQQSIKRTLATRPENLEVAELSENERALLEDWKSEGAAGPASA